MGREHFQDFASLDEGEGSPYCAQDPCSRSLVATLFSWERETTALGLFVSD